MVESLQEQLEFLSLDPIKSLRLKLAERKMVYLHNKNNNWYRSSTYAAWVAVWETALTECEEKGLDSAELADMVPDPDPPGSNQAIRECYALLYPDKSNRLSYLS